MFRWLAKVIFKLKGWKVEGKIPPDVKKCVLIAAPHTSNWDFIYALGAFSLMDIKIRFTIKIEFKAFPIGPILKNAGAIFIDRYKSRSISNKGKTPSMVDVMVDIMKESDDLVLMITPEGTRSFVPKWHSGFYHIAKRANVPVALGYLDYKEKEAGVLAMYDLTEDKDADINRIKAFYADVTPKYPEQGVRGVLKR